MNLAPLTLLLLAPTAAVAQDAAPFSAETYGTVSGDVPMRGLGLVLELVQAGADEPRLRLFGGPAGEPAAIFVSTSASRSVGPMGESRLVGGPATRIEGTFDWNGSFEVPLGDIAGSGITFYAQGVHCGVFGLGPGGRPLTQFSNGLEVSPAPSNDEALGFDDLLPHLPEFAGIVPASATLAERLQAYLNSAGDSATITLHVEGNGGTGANVGGAGEIELAVERTAEGVYELVVSLDLGVTVGVEVAEGLEAGARQGVGTSQVFRFHSAPGLARGILGFVIMSQTPDLGLGRELASTGLLGVAEEHVQRARAAVEFAREHVDEAEAILRNVLETAATRAAERRAAARDSMQTALRRLAAASWRQRPGLAVRAAAATARYSAAHSGYVVAIEARDAGRAAVAGAKRAFEEHRGELRAALAAIARLHGIASAVSQLRDYTEAHHAGTSFRQALSGSVEVGIPIPVDLANVGAGVEAGAEVTIEAFFGLPDETGRRQLEITRRFETVGTAAAGCAVGGEYEFTRTGSLVESFEIGGGEGLSTSRTASFERDARVRGLVGALVAVGAGVGRSRSVSVESATALDPNFDLGGFLRGEGGASYNGLEVGFELQDRTVRTIDVGLIASVAGNGGGFELSIEWADRGRLLSRSTTIREALTTLRDGVDQIPDPDSDSVILN